MSSHFNYPGPHDDPNFSDPDYDSWTEMSLKRRRLEDKADEDYDRMKEIEDYEATNGA